jgi:hypothetical protein
MSRDEILFRFWSDALYNIDIKEIFSASGSPPRGSALEGLTVQNAT